MANPATPKKTTIRRAVVARLETIRRANGYWTELGLNVAADRKPIQLHRAGELPRAAVTWGTEAPADKKYGQCLGGVRVACPFFVYVVLGTKRAELQNAMDYVDADVKRALAGSIDGAILFPWIGSATDQQLLAAEDGGAVARAQVAVTFEAVYDTTANAV